MMLGMVQERAPRMCARHAGIRRFDRGVRRGVSIGMGESRVPVLGQRLGKSSTLAGRVLLLHRRILDVVGHVGLECCYSSQVFAMFESGGAKILRIKVYAAPGRLGISLL